MFNVVALHHAKIGGNIVTHLDCGHKFYSLPEHALEKIVKAYVDNTRIVVINPSDHE